MSFVDYGQTVEDHQSLLVLVRHTGSSLPAHLFRRVWERIRSLNSVHVQGQNRNVIVRYKRTYPTENNEWGDFQAHRKVLGLISVGKCVDHKEFEDLFENYKKVKEEYASTIINSRLIIYGMNTDGSPLDEEQGQSPSSETSGSEIGDLGVKSQTGLSYEPCLSSSEFCDTDSCGNPTDITAEVKALSEKAKASQVGRDIPLSDHDSGLGIIMEGSETSSMKSSSLSGNDSDSISIGLQNLEKDSATGKEGTVKAIKETNGTVSDSNGKVVEVRRPHSKSLTKESTGSEVVFYPNIDQCADLEERLREFVTSLFFVLEGKRLERSFERNDRLVLLCAPFEKKDYVGVDTDTKTFRKRCLGRLRKHLGDLCLQASLPGEAILHYQTSLDWLRSVNDFLWMGGCYEGLCASSVIMTYPKSNSAPLKRNLSFSVKRGASTPDLKQRPASLKTQTTHGSTIANGLDHLEGPSLHCLNPDDIIEKYKEAIINYSKYKNAGMIEMEASLKACRVLISQGKYLQASDFLQNVVYINFPTSEEEKVQKFITLSSLYGQIGFMRKEAFFKRVAAMQCVSQSASSPAWHQCYQLLLQALTGYNIALDPREMPQGSLSGWPVIQYQVLHELVCSARRIGNPQLAVRHMTLLVHTMLPHMTPKEQQEVVEALKTLSDRCQGTPQPLSTNTGLILPPVNLTTLPTVKLFQPLSATPHLRPVKIAVNDDSTGSIFIYTPLSLGQADKKGDSCSVDFQWVAEDMCEVQLQVINPFSVELQLLYLALLTEALDVELFPVSPTIPPDSDPITIKLTAKPKKPGQLKILGYATQVFGVKSHCKLRDLTSIAVPPYYVVEVIPALSQVTLSCSLPKAVTFASSSSSEGATVVANTSTILYAGQSQDCVVTLDNVSLYSVTSLGVKLGMRTDARECVNKMFAWSDENIQSQLPLQPGNQLCMTLALYGYSDFLLPPVTSPELSSSSVSSHSRTENLDIKGTQTVEALLAVQYSGGPGHEAGYCRRCSLAVTVDILPSIYITNWDAVPLSSGQEVALVLDLLNASSHQIDVQCGSGTGDGAVPVIIESQQCRRIVVTVPRVLFPEQEKSQTFESQVPSKYRTWRVPDFYSQYLSQFVDVRWSMSAAKVSGKVSIDHLKWSSPQLEVIRVPAVSWEVSLNGRHYVNMAPDLMHFAVEQPITVNITVSASQGAETVQDVRLGIQPMQEGGQGELQHPVEPSAFICLGCQTRLSPKLGPGSSLSHNCTLVFLCAGHYRLHISCCGMDSSSGTELSWRCLPVPELTVVENAAAVV